MYRLLYGTTTSVVVTLSEYYYGSIFYYMYFAERFNASPPNPPSSNPLRLFLDYQEIVRTNDVMNPKFVVHKRAVRQGVRKVLAGNVPLIRQASRAIDVMGISAMQPYLAILEADTYRQRAGPPTAAPPALGGSPTAVEYLIREVYGPKHPGAEMHLQKLHF